MRNRLVYLLIVCSGILPAILFGQTEPQNYTAEKILIYTDKPFYLSGETIYYRLVVTKGKNNSPANLSNAVYTALDNQTGNLLHSKILLANRACSGAFELPEDLASGSYLLKAASNNMKNISKEIFFTKNIRIVNYQQSKDTILHSSETEKAEKDLQVSIRPDQKSYFAREKVSVDIATDNPDAPVSFSVAVNKIDSLIDEDVSIAVQVQSAYGPSPVAYRNSQPFYGPPDERYRLDDYVRFTKLEEVFREYVKGVGMGIGVSDKKRLFIYDGATRMPFKQNPFIVLDGYAVSDISRLMEIDPLKINTIEVVTRKYFYGRDVYYGIVNIQTYNGDLAGFEPDSNDSLAYESLPAQRIFEQPKYNSAALKASRHPDFRSSLYWRPELRAGKDGKAHFEFYTSDLKGKFKITVYALTDSGSMGEHSETITVN